MIKRSNAIAQWFAIMVMSLAFSACSKTGQTDAYSTSFHKLSAPSREHLQVSPLGEDKITSVEFGQYARLIRQHFKNAGYHPAEKQPELIATFDVLVGDGHKTLTRHEGSKKIVTKKTTGKGYETAYDQAFFDDPEAAVHSPYSILLTIQIRNTDGKLLFEGRAETETQTKSVPDVVPLLADILFTNFPGTSGVTRHLKIDLNEDGSW